jgi:hypothetical protein
LHATHQDHGIDAASAEHVTEGHVEIAVVQLGQRSDRQVVIERTAEIVKSDTWVREWSARRRVLRT